MADKIIHALKPGIEAQKADNQQPEVDAVTRKLFDDSEKSMVKIKTDDGSGSGFVISKDGEIATDAHVVLGSKHVTVVSADGVEHKARITKLDDINDLAIVRIDDQFAQEIKPIELGSSKDLKADQPLWALGHPSGWDPLYVSPGYFRKHEVAQDVLDSENQNVRDHAQKVLSGLTPKEKEDADAELKKPMFNARINIQKGDSGGAVIEGNGKVVGIVDISNLRSDSDFTPVEKLITFIEDKPKFTFTYKDIDGRPTLTDISRNSGEYRPPFVDTIVCMPSSFVKNQSPDTAQELDGSVARTMKFYQ